MTYGGKATKINLGRDKMKAYFFKSKLESNATAKGRVAGTAYSGGAIPHYMHFENFIIDTESLSIAKERIALLKDHLSERVIGHASASVKDHRVEIEGNLSPTIEAAKEVITLANDGFEWEMSVGVYDGYVQENFSGKVNGIEVENATVLRDGVLREVSIVALGADMHTNAKIFNNNSTKEHGMNVKDRKRLAKAFKLATDAEIEEILEKAEEVVAEAEEAQEEVEEVKKEVDQIKQEVDDKDELIESLKARVEELEAALEAIKDEGDAEDREGEIEAALKSKGIELAKEKIKELAKSKESADVFLSTIKSVKVSKSKIDAKFCKKETFDRTGEVTSLREQANQMVKAGNARNFTEAISALVKSKGE